MRLAEYELLRKEHERLLQSRQQLLLAVLAASAGFLGVILANQSILSSSSFSTIFLLLPLGFTLLAWWYIRNNYSVLLIELYLLSELKPNIEKIIGNEALLWANFQWEEESSEAGRFIVFTQTLSKLGLVQGSAIVSLFTFASRTNWNFSAWSFWDWILILLNLVGIIVTARLVLITYSLVKKIRQKTKPNFGA